MVPYFLKSGNVGSRTQLSPCSGRGCACWLGQQGLQALLWIPAGSCRPCGKSRLRLQLDGSQGAPALGRSSQGALGWSGMAEASPAWPIIGVAVGENRSGQSAKGWSQQSGAGGRSGPLQRSGQRQPDGSARLIPAPRPATPVADG